MGEDKKEVKAKVVIKAGFWYTASAFLTKGVAFITTPIFARLLSSSDYGEYSNYVAWAGIIALITTMDMHTTVNRARYDYENIDGYLSSVAITGSVVTAIAWGIILLFPSFFSSFFSLDVKYINIILVTTMVSPALSLLQAKNRIRYKYKAYVALSFGSVIVSTIVSLLFVLLFDNKLEGRILGQYGTVFFIDVCIYIYIIGKGKHYSFQECKYALMICIPMIPHLLSKYILNQSDRIMIKQFCGASETALYSLAYSCAMIPIMLATATNIAWSPWSSEKIHEGKLQSVKKASYYYITLFNLLVIMIFLLGPEIIYILGGKKYADSLYVLPPVVMGGAFQFLCNLFVALEQFAKKTVGMALGTVLAAIINIVLNWLLIPKYGYIAAAYTTLFGYVCLLIIHYFLAKRTGYIDAYDIRFISSFLFALFIIMLMTLWLYKMSSIYRYALLLCVIVVLVRILNKKRILITSFLRK